MPCRPARRERPGSDSSRSGPGAPALAGSAAALAVLSALACTPTHDWREVRPAGTDLRLLFPCKPDRLARAVAMAGGRVDTELLVCRAGGASFSLTVARPADPRLVDEVLRELGQGPLAGAMIRPGPLLPYALPGATPHAGSTAQVFEGSGPRGQPIAGRVARFAHGPTVFQLVLLAEGPVADDVSETFFASPRLSGPAFVR